MMDDWAGFWTIVAFLGCMVGFTWLGMEIVRGRLRKWCDTHAPVDVSRYHDGYRDALEAVQSSVYRFKAHFYISKQGEI
jgi:hypothetical protein